MYYIHVTYFYLSRPHPLAIAVSFDCTVYDRVIFSYFLVQYGVCPRSYKSGIWWTRTKFGVQRIEPCPTGSIGNATRICKDNSVGWEETDLSGCTSTQFLVLNSSVSVKVQFIIEESWYLEI